MPVCGSGKPIGEGIWSLQSCGVRWRQRILTRDLYGSTLGVFRMSTCTAQGYKELPRVNSEVLKYRIRADSGVERTLSLSTTVTKSKSDLSCCMIQRCRLRNCQFKDTQHRCPPPGAQPAPNDIDGFAYNKHLQGHHPCPTTIGQQVSLRATSVSPRPQHFSPSASVRIARAPRIAADRNDQQSSSAWADTEGARGRMRVKVVHSFIFDTGKLRCKIMFSGLIGTEQAKFACQQTQQVGDIQVAVC